MEPNPIDARPLSPLDPKDAKEISELLEKPSNTNELRALMMERQISFPGSPANNTEMDEYGRTISEGSMTEKPRLDIRRKLVLDSPPSKKKGGRKRKRKTRKKRKKKTKKRRRKKRRRKKRTKRRK